MRERKLSRNKILIISVAVVIVLVVVVVLVLAVLSQKPQPVTINNKDYSIVVETDEQAQQFVNQFFSTDSLYSIQQEYVPIEFNDTYSEYNELQKKQGFDLSEYKGKLCTVYIYKLNDFSENGKTTYANVLVHEDRVIGGHISTMIKDAAMYTFCGEKYE